MASPVESYTSQYQGLGGTTSGCMASYFASSRSVARYWVSGRIIPVKAMVPAYSRTNRGGPRGGFILVETLVQNGSASDNGTAGGFLNQPVFGFLSGRMKPPLGGISSGSVWRRARECRMVREAGRTILALGGDLVDMV